MTWPFKCHCLFNKKTHFQWYSSTFFLAFIKSWVSTSDHFSIKNVCFWLKLKWKASYLWCRQVYDLRAAIWPTMSSRGYDKTLMLWQNVTDCRHLVLRSHYPQCNVAGGGRQNRPHWLVHIKCKAQKSQQMKTLQNKTQNMDTHTNQCMKHSKICYTHLKATVNLASRLKYCSRRAYTVPNRDSLLEQNICLLVTH